MTAHTATRHPAPAFAPVRAAVTYTAPCPHCARPCTWTGTERPNRDGHTTNGGRCHCTTEQPATPTT